MTLRGAGHPRHPGQEHGPAHGSWRGHTRVDTIDELEWRNLREQAILLTELTVKLASEETDLPHRDTADLLAQLEAEGLADGMKRTGRWSY